MKALAEFAQAIEGVEGVQVHARLCGEAGQERISKGIREMGVDRVVVVGCSPDILEETIPGALKTEGFNSYLWAVANVREQCAWVHEDAERATEKAKNLIAAAVARVKLLEPIVRKEVAVTPCVLVIGGGLAGLETSRVLGDVGCAVTLVEREKHLGGQLRKISYLYEEDLNPEDLVRGLVDRVTEAASVTVRTSTEVANVEGQIGHFRVSLSNGNGLQTMDFGTIVAATGLEAISPVGECGLPSDRFTTLLALQKIIRERGKLPKRIALILDMDREDGSVLTGAALRTAVAIRERSPSEVYLLCRNMRVAGDSLESLYAWARELGVVVFKMEEQPEIALGDYTATFSFKDVLSGSNIRLECDLAAFAERVGPNGDSGRLGEVLGVRLGPERFLQDDNVWLSPTDSNRKGIFLAGACRELMDVQRTLVDAQTAAMKAYEVLDGGKWVFDADKAEVDADKCVLCLTCVRSCPMRAIEVDWEREVAKVMEEACDGCGICAAECPAKAIELRGVTDAQVRAEVGEWGNSAAPPC
jgi:heterodisulfide reductase subunit A-like polyferredoxin